MLQLIVIQFKFIMPSVILLKVVAPTGGPLLLNKMLLTFQTMHEYKNKHGRLPGLNVMKLLIHEIQIILFFDPKCMYNNNLSVYVIQLL